MQGWRVYCWRLYFACNARGFTLHAMLEALLLEALLCMQCWRLYCWKIFLTRNAGGFTVGGFTWHALLEALLVEALLHMQCWRLYCWMLYFTSLRILLYILFKNKQFISKYLSLEDEMI